jgi:hypothetical protein
MPKGVNDVDLIVVSGDKFLAFHKTSLFVVLSPNYVNLATQKAHPEVSSLTLHGFDVGEGLICRTKVLIFHY